MDDILDEEDTITNMSNVKNMIDMDRSLRALISSYTSLFSRLTVVEEKIVALSCAPKNNDLSQ
jgi:hypothetical protein